MGGMVYVVERYLPGLAHSDLLHGLSRLERVEEEQRDPHAVRYLGSTIVLGDDACFCQFEGPSEAAVAEANREAGLPFDRIVPALTVTREGSTTMTVSPSIPHTIEMRRSRLLGGVVAVAAAAAAITWALVTYAVNTGDGSAQSTSIQVQNELATSYENALGAPGRARQTSLGPAQQRALDVVNSLTPAQLRGIRWYWTPAAVGGPGR